MCPQALLKSAPHGQTSARIWEASTYMHQYDQYHILCIAIIVDLHFHLAFSSLV